MVNFTPAPKSSKLCSRFVVKLNFGSTTTFERKIPVTNRWVESPKSQTPPAAGSRSELLPTHPNGRAPTWASVALFAEVWDFRDNPTFTVKLQRNGNLIHEEIQ